MTRANQHQILAQLIRELRTSAELKQSELAERLGVSQSEVSKYEAGERGLDVIELRDLCEACGISLGEFASRLEARLKGKPNAGR